MRPEFRKVVVSFRLDEDIDYMIPRLIERAGLRETPSEFMRLAVRERFNRIIDQGHYELDRDGVK